MAALTPGATVLLQAPPGAGKTTRAPLALLERFGQEGILLLVEPRRLAARAAAHRLAQGLDEPVGGRVGYRVRLESRISAATRLEVVTGGVFLRRLQEDPALEGVACVAFDEFHERGVEADLGLALVRQARTLLRPDLRLLVMSATLDLEPLAGALGDAGDATVIHSTGRSHPVEVLHQPPRPGERLAHQVVRALETHWLPQRDPGETVLVFLPGQSEIRASQRAISEAPWEAPPECTPLHGHLPLAAQSRVLSPTGERGGRVVLATSIAESSLTIEGVRLVIDAGLSRRNRFDPAKGMDALVTVPASLASAEQRRGRAGRLAPGRCVRLWSPGEAQRRPAFDPPELLEADPLPLALQLAAWGSPLGEDLPWLQPPPPAALAEARRLLTQLGALDAGGAITPHGRAMARLGIHPRLAHMLLLAARHGWLGLASSLAVLLSERDPLDPRQEGCDLLRRLDWLRCGSSSSRRTRQEGEARETHQRERLRTQLQRQVRDLVGATERVDVAAAEPEDTVAARLVAWAFPERLALARPQGEGRFLLRSGHGARVHPQDPLAGAPALAVATVDGMGEDARVLLAVAAPPALVEEVAEREGVLEQEARWDAEAERVRGERTLRLGALIVRREAWQEASEEAVRSAMAEGLRSMGPSALPWCPRSRQLQQRLCLAHQHLGLPWPDRREETLASEPERWLGEQLQGVRSRRDLQGIDLLEALWGDLDWKHRQQLDSLLPERVPVPSGRRVPIDYSGGEPVLAVRLQEMFGCTAVPALLDGRLPIRLHLLSPAGRPAAITQDLARFWGEGYREVRRELRGRYPRHPWPEDPRTAAPSFRPGRPR